MGWATRSRFPAEVGIFFLRHRIQTGSGNHPVSYPMSTRVFFFLVKLLGHAADYSPPSSAAVKNIWTSTPPYIFITWCLIKQRSSSVEVKNAWSYTSTTHNAPSWHGDQLKNTGISLLLSLPYVFMPWDFVKNRSHFYFYVMVGCRKSLCIVYHPWFYLRSLEFEFHPGGWLFSLNISCISSASPEKSWNCTTTASSHTRFSLSLTFILAFDFVCLIQFEQTNN